MESISEENVIVEEKNTQETPMEIAEPSIKPKPITIVSVMTLIGKVSMIAKNKIGYENTLIFLTLHLLQYLLTTL